MDLIDQLRLVSAQVAKQVENVKTEEATKTALVMPFINALGYNVFDPTEVVPELVADVGTKKGEKVDYAIQKDGKVIILMECKWHGYDLDNEHASQLFRYFTVTEARFGILTNGIVYRFFTDADEPNIMDAKPFFEFNILDFTDAQVFAIKRFTKQAFDIDGAFSAAIELKYTREIKRVMAEELAAPSDDFVRFFVSRVYSGRMTQAVRQQFAELIKRALGQFMNDKLNERLKSAMEHEASIPAAGEAPEPPAENTSQTSRDVVTTMEELEGYYAVKSILHDIVDPNRIAIRDTQNYCGILLDNTNRRPICRLRFDGPTKFLGLIKDSKQEERVRIDSINDIFSYADHLRSTIAMYEKMLAKDAPGPGGTE